MDALEALDALDALDAQATGERVASARSGLTGFLFTVLLIAATIALIAGAVLAREELVLMWALILGAVLSGLGALFVMMGFLTLQPNQASVLVIFGAYQGTLRESGWWWVNPLAVFERRKISLRARNFNSTTSKVNDANGNPINIAAVVVWRVIDTARAVFDVDDYEDFVVVQSETAVRHLARSFPYDDYGDDQSALTLTGDAEEIAITLTQELQDRLDAAGVQVIEARLTDLSYAPEIAESMLRRQQASAIVAARQRIVDGAVGMVQMALQQLEAGNIVELDDERKATMVSNLLTVLTSDQPTNPVVNVGTLSR
ncbi:MAG: SPFH domain-containing protein [Dehalococcoidia bacterium]|nr:SPFH domain-containing protein [Dehalococcoidia bacterium]